MSTTAVLSAVLSEDTHNFVDAALARVRVDARLDADPVLPPLDVLLPAPLRRRPPPLPPSAFVAAVPQVEWGTLVIPTPVPIPSAHAIVAEVARKNAPTVAITRKEIITEHRRSARWPLFLC